MLSVQSKITPCFLGDIEQLIEDFLEEYERLMDRYGLTGPQKVETVIWYIDHSQCHIWQHCQVSSIAIGMPSATSSAKNTSPPPLKASTQDRS
jgi:hypothetical protein